MRRARLIANKIVRRGLRRLGHVSFYKRGLLPGETMAMCWDDIALAVDFRPGDSVLDMGCADGLVTLEVAKRVARVEGVDIDAARIAAARRAADRASRHNATFATGSALEHPLESYDIVLLLGVIGRASHIAGLPRQGLACLERLLPACRRQLVVRAGIGGAKADIGLGLSDLLACMDTHGFDAVCLGRHELLRTLIIGNRRGTDARLRKVTPFVFVPAQQMRDHPCLKDTEIGSHAEFGL